MGRIIFILFFCLVFSSASLYAACNFQENIPITVINPKYDYKTAPVAIIVSGDGGWYKFEQEIADSLAAIGIPTIGLDTKKYFWNRRTPEETAADLAKSINQYNAAWKRNKFLFIGYSLGAELVPFIVNKLPEPIRSQISMLVLLSPTATTDFQVHISDMLGVGNRHNTYKVIDEINKITGIHILLIFGAEEKTTVPSMLTKAPVKLVKIPGDHHYNHDAYRIVRTMKEHNAF